MRRSWLVLFLLFLSGGSWAALINVDTDYRVTEVRRDQRQFGIALVRDNPNETQNDVYFGADTLCYREIRYRNGMRKQIPVTIERFFKILHKGDIVHVRGGRDWDGSIHAYEVRIKTLY